MTRKNIETTPTSNFNIGEIITVHTEVLKKKKYCSGYIVVENSQPDKLMVFNIFTNNVEFVKTSADIYYTEIISENSNTDNLKTYDIVVFKDSISRKKMKVFFINKIHRDNTCDLIHVNTLDNTDKSLALTLKNVKMNLLMHVVHSFRITRKTNYNDKTYTFQDYKFGLTNDPEKNIIVGTLEKNRGQSESEKKNNDIICCSTINSETNKERVLLNRCFIYLNDPSIVFKASSEHMRMLFSMLSKERLPVNNKD